jgi:hypothetical protein
MRYRFLLFAGAWACAGNALSAQSQFLAARPSAWTTWAPPVIHEEPRGANLVKAQDYRREGMIIGGSALGVGTSVLVYGLCRGFENPGSVGECLAKGLVGAAGGALVGVGVGGLIGGLFPKSH